MSKNLALKCIATLGLRCGKLVGRGKTVKPYDRVLQTGCHTIRFTFYTTVFVVNIIIQFQTLFKINLLLINPCN